MNILSLFLVCGASITVVLLSEQVSAKVLNAPDLKVALLCSCFVMSASALKGVQSGVISGFERFDLNAKLSILESISSTAAMLLLTQHFGLNGAVVGLSVGPFLSWLFGAQIIRHELLKRGVSLTANLVWSDIARIAGYGLPIFLANTITSPVLWYSMTLVTKAQNGFEQLGIYNAAYQWHGPIILIPMILMSTSIPSLVCEWEAGRKEVFRKIVIYICCFTLLVSLIPVIILSFFSREIMMLYGSLYSSGWFILVILLAAAPFHAITKILAAALQGMDSPWGVLWANIAWSTTMLSLVLILVNKWSILGLSIAFLCAYVVQAVVSIALVASKNTMKQPQAARNDK